MKAINLYAASLVFASVLSAPAIADDHSSQEGIYLGAKTGKVKIDVEGFDDPTSTGVVLGYNFGQVALELEYNRAEPEYDGTLSPSLAGKYDYDTKAVYVAYRTSGDFYFKAKGGYLRETVNDNQGSSANDSGLSIGGGVGARISAIAIEAEYTIAGEDSDLLTVGLIFKF